ncbi:hypothetical protein L6R52_03795, partial [Myxococcota bacterium]|nr:hypothetical protein [Myxococcota bacterium]
DARPTRAVGALRGASRALVAKDLRGNLGSAALAAVASVALAATIFVTFVSREAPSIFDGARLAVRVLAPLVAWFLAERLFVQEHRAKTIDLLVAMPVSLVRVALSKLALSLAAILALTIGLVTAAAVLASFVEHVDVALWAVAVMQSACYAISWWGLTSLAAQLGRYLVSAVTVLLCWVVVAFALDSSTDLQPFAGALGRAFSAAALAPPWAMMITSSITGVIAAVGAVAIFVRDGGIFVRGLFERRAAQANVVTFMLAAGVTAFLPSPTDDLGARAGAATGLVSVGRIVHTAGIGRVRRIAESLEGHLVALETELGLEPFSPVALVPSFAPLRTAAERRWRWEGEIYALDLGRSDEELVAALLTEILSNRDFSDISRRRDWISSGFAEYWLRRRGHVSVARRELLEARAEWAARHLADAGLAFPADWSKVEEAIGAPLARVLAREGLEAFAERCGEERARVIARDRFGRARSASRTVRLFERALRSEPRDTSECGPEAQWLDAAWRGRVEALASRTSARTFTALPSPHTRPERTSRADAFELAVRVEGLPPGAELWWRPVDPLLAPEGRDAPSRDALRVIPLRDERAVARVTLPLDPRQHALATIAFWSEPLAEWVTVPWQDVSAR